MGITSLIILHFGIKMTLLQSRLLGIGKSLIFRQCSNISNALPSDHMPDKLFERIELELRAHEPAVLKSYSWFACSAAKELNIPVDKSWAPEEPHKERKTLLKAAYVNKKHRVQYEMRTYYHFMSLKHLTGSTADTYLEYIQRNLPEGVSMKVIKHEVRKMIPEVAAPISQEVPNN